jgi:uncharacterized protein YodC (DUF2158 family)
MFNVGDKAIVKSSGALGVIQEILTETEVCIEFDRCAGSRTSFHYDELEPVDPIRDVTGKIEIIQGDKGL